MLAGKLRAATATAAGAEGLPIEDLFSTYLYTGNGSTQTITNGIDLAGEGGLVWLKRRDNIGNNGLFSSNFGDPPSHYLISNSTGGQGGSSNIVDLLSNGFSVNGAIGDFGVNNATYASWTFRKAPRFFDVVTYTGDGVAGRTISHGLGVVPGMIVVKRLDNTGNWQCYHRSLTSASYHIRLNNTDAEIGPSTAQWNGTDPTDSVFTVGTDFGINESGGTYVAYLFAHDPLGPSGDGSDGLIACGSYTGTGSAGLEIDLGWEPQWLLVKSATRSVQHWELIDTMRGFTSGRPDERLRPAATSAGESTFNIFEPTATGFKTGSNVLDETNESGQTYIYIAIRRGPMRQPTSGTEVFAMDTRNATNPGFVSGWPVDAALRRTSVSGGSDSQMHTRMLGATVLNTDSTAAEGTSSDTLFDFMTGWRNTPSVNSDDYSWMFRRSPRFFDVVAYTGNGVAGRTVPHNLGVAPEMMIVKARSETRDWSVYHAGMGNTHFAKLNTTDAAIDYLLAWNDTTPDETFFTLGWGPFANGNNQNFIAYLFATLPGVSKVGSYTGNGTSQTIDCGFTSGARFILIKRTDSTGDWYVWDTARGIVTGNDPHLSLNTTAAEVTTNDSIDPDSSGFIVNQVAATNINVSSASYIYLAIS